MTRSRFPALVVTVLAVVPALALASGGPATEHQVAESLCREADAVGMLVGASGAAGVAPAVVPAVREPRALAAELLALYASNGVAVTPALRFAVARGVGSLHPDVARPVAILAAAVVDAGRLNAEAFAGLTAGELARVREMAADPSAERTAADAAIVARVDVVRQVEAAALLLRAVDVAEPLVRDAVEAGRWPKVTPALWDPLRLVYVGGTGDDAAAGGKVLSVDPGGDDSYVVPVGGADLLGATGRAASLAVDFAGADRYMLSTGPQIGAAVMGVALFSELGGDDSYGPSGTRVAGAGNFGVGVFDERTGDDEYGNLAISFGASSTGLAIAVEGGGDDRYNGDGFGVADGLPPTVGSFCDASGADSYASQFSYGWGWSSQPSPGALATFADVGGSPDAYVGGAGTTARNDDYWVNVDPDFGSRGYGLDV